MNNWLNDHPYANPRREPHVRQRRYMFRDKKGNIVFTGVEDRSRWLAHQGVSEIARRARQITAGTLEVSRG